MQPVPCPLSRRQRVLVLDSGIGGLTIVQALRRRLPDLSIIYLADNAGFPYGNLAPDVLSARLSAHVEHYCTAYACTAVVLACNTASTVALAAVRERVAVPVVGVVPAIKPAALLSRTRAIGLLATPVTVCSPYVDELIERFAADCRVVRVGPADLALLAEARYQGEPPAWERLREIVAPFFGADAPPVDTVVLGCTHYPLLLDELQHISPPGVRWLEPGPAVARRLEQVLRGVPAAADGLDNVALFTAPTNLETLAGLLDECGLTPRLTSHSGADCAEKTSAGHSV